MLFMNEHTGQKTQLDIPTNVIYNTLRADSKNPGGVSLIKIKIERLKLYIYLYSLILFYHRT